MSYPPLPSNGETQWGNKFRAWADALEGRKVEGEGLSLRRDTSVGTRLFLDHPGGSTMLWGDTGRRNVTSMCTGIESGTVYIRRTTTDVQWQFQAVMLTPGAGTLQLTNTVPTGWRPTDTSVTETVARQTSHAHRQSFAIQGPYMSWMSESSVSQGGSISIIRPDKVISGVFTAPATGWPTAQIGTPA